MDTQREPREASPRALEGGLALTPSSRGRFTAPHLSLWLPVAAKAAVAAGAALILAVIGLKAGAHAPPPAVGPAASGTPSVVAAAVLGGLPGLATEGDSGSVRTSHDSPDPASVASAGATTFTRPSDDAESPPSGAQSTTALPGDGLLADGRVVLNAASETELTKLPGIGPSRARAILALRQRITKFRAVEDLLRVKGIGRKMLRRLRPSVVLDRPAGDASGASPAPRRTPPPTDAEPVL